MKHLRPLTPEEQQQRDERAFRFILRDYHLYKDQNMLPLMPNMEKAVVRWFKKVNGMCLDDSDKEPPSS